MPESVGEARHALRGWAENLTLTAASATAILLALSEAATNAVRHGYPGGAPEEAVRIHAEIDGGRLLLDGRGRRRRARGSPPDPGLGIGLPVLGKLADAVAIVSAPERGAGTEVQMWFALESLATRP